MTIQFTQTVTAAGTTYTSGQQATLEAQTEHRIVGMSMATWVGTPPYIDEPGIGGGNVVAQTNPDGSTSLIGPGGFLTPTNAQ